MDKGFIEASAAYWDKRVDTLAPQSRPLETETEQAFAKLTATFTDEQMALYMDAEDAINRRDAQIKEFFYKAGFKDAVQFMCEAFNRDCD